MKHRYSHVFAIPMLALFAAGCIEPEGSDAELLGEAELALVQPPQCLDASGGSDTVSVACTSLCGDGLCDSSESSLSCPADCGASAPLPPGDPPPPEEPSPYSRAWSSGVADSYSTSNGIESPRPSAGLRTWVANNYYYPEIRNYDDARLDRYFAHTFTGLAPSWGWEICSGSLTVRMRAGGSREWFMLAFVDAAGTQQPERWSRLLEDLGMSPGTERTLTFDLARLPTATGTYDLLPWLNRWGYLDLTVQDDTTIDYSRLWVTYCPLTCY